MPRTKICRGCGIEFVPKRSHNVFCSKECFDRWQTGRPNPANRTKKIIKTCPQCGKTFSVTPSFDYRVYCSQECYGLSRVGVPFNVRENNPQWKGGITIELELARKTPEYDNWRIAVFERDNYTCQECGQHSGELHAHHVKSFADYPELRHDVNNGLTLCAKCHRNIHFPT